MSIDHAGAGRRAEPDLRGFLLSHSAFRAEFGRLAIAARRIRDLEHERLVEDQIELVTTHLEHHHHDEDAWMWPLLRRRSPQAVAVLDALEEQHELIDPLLRTVADRGRPLAERAEVMVRLHGLLNDHLDQEERDAVPLVRSVILPEEFAAAAKRATASVSRGRVPVFFGWLASCGDPAQVHAILGTFAWPVRFLFHRLWWPAYRRRYQSLYGCPLRRYAAR